MLPKRTNNNKSVFLVSNSEMIKKLNNDSFFQEIEKNIKRKNTISTYKTYIDQYALFCTINSYDELSQISLLFFLKEIIHIRKQSVSTGKTAYYAISTIFEKNNTRLDSYIFKNFFSGVANMKAEKNEPIKEKTKALTLDLLMKEYDSISNDYQLLIKWLYLGAFRVSELISLKVSDLEFRANGVYITIRYAKNLKVGREFIKFIPYSENTKDCAATEMKNRVKSLKATDLIFDGYKRTAVTNYINRKFEGYTSHSLRAGHVTDAVNAGQTLEQICKQTGQTVQTAQSYIDSIAADQNNSVNTVAKNLFEKLKIR